VSYHKTLTYFFTRFHIQNPAILEPKPGIPPTSGHIIEVIQIIREKKIPLVMVENYFDPTVTNRIKEDVPGIRIAVVPVSVDGAPGIKTLDDLYEKLVSTIEGK
jgi:zinc/manganese transport system substrate-binding protein